MQSKAALLLQGVDLARQRRVVLKELIQHSPEEAIASALPHSIRGQLPDSISSYLEERISGVGEFKVVAATPKRDAQIVAPLISRHIEINGRFFVASVFGWRASQKTTSSASLHGIAMDGAIALSDSPLRLLEPGETTSPDKPIIDQRCPISRKQTSVVDWTLETGTHTYRICSAAHAADLEKQIIVAEGDTSAATYSTQGAKQLLVIMVEFPDIAGGILPREQAISNLHRVSDFLRANSFGQFWFSAIEVTHPIRVPNSASYYTDSNHDGAAELMREARAAAQQQGYSLDSYPFDLIAFANIGFNWTGLGYVGAKGAWIQGDLHPGVCVHELGHNLGLWHAGSWQSPSTIGAGSRVEYGNPFDAMGNAWNFPNNHYSANFRFLLGWLTPGNIVTVNQPGRYRIHAADQALSIDPSRHYAIKIPAGVAVLDTQVDYWIDYRRRVINTAVSTDGAVIQWGNDLGTSLASLLLDMTPGTAAGANDAPLRNGRTFTDQNHDLAISVVGGGGSGADAYVDIRVGPIQPHPTLVDGLDESHLAWTTGGSAPWDGSLAPSHDGSDSAQSGLIPDGQESWMETTFVGPGTLSYWWKVSSEPKFDRCRLIINGREVKSISGEVDWRFVTHALEIGTHRVRWVYSKDLSVSLGSDQASVDEVSFSSGGQNHVIYVDRLYTGAVSDGTLPHPFRSVSEGDASRVPCSILRIAAGSYPDQRRFSKCGRIEGFGGRVRLGLSTAQESPVARPEGASLTSLALSSAGGMSFEFRGQNGQAYQILTSTNLVSWTVWKEFVADEESAVLRPPDAPREPQRFFRWVSR